MSIRDANHRIMQELSNRGIELSYEDVNTLRRAELTLHRWQESECGTGNGCIERDNQTGKPYYVSSLSGARYAVNDLEAGAIRRIKSICERTRLWYYIQGDCRGAALYIDNKPIVGNNYNRAYCLCGR